MDITLSAEQETLFNIMEQTDQHLFITGRAGAGKSVLLRHFREHTRKRVVVAAPTGIAALNVKGQTIHSLFKLAPGLYHPGSLEPNSRLYTLLKRIDTLIIDEISMVRADLLDAIDERFRRACNNDLPFGGKQIIMFGDCYQLPPVVDRDLMQYFEDVHSGYFFFNALVWKNAEFKIFELTQVFRQKDPVFKDILNAVRDGSFVESQIEQLNARYGVPNDGKTVTLAPTNSLVTNINQKRLNQLEGEIYEYKASISGKMSKSTFPTEEVIQLKVGAQVVLLQNDKDKRWVNGSVATISSLQKFSREEETEEKITVCVDGTDYVLEKVTWEEIKYEYQGGKVKAEVVSSFTQYPIRLAWALTIHKSQGQTYQSVELDLTTAAFAPGQMYVALSRCTSLEGLYLKMPVKPKDIIVDAKVSEFMARRETIKVVEEPEQAVISDIHHDEIEALEPEQTKALVVVSVSSVPAEIHHDEITPTVFASSLTLMSNQFHHDGIREDVIEATQVREVEDAPMLVEGKVSRIAAIEVLCPSCNSPCADPATQSQLITYNLVGHIVVCSNCGMSCIVPLNAFSLQGEVIAREQLKGVTNAKREKKGRTKKEKTSNRGRKAKDGVVREPCQLSLSIHTINALNAMGINKSALFEELLQQYQPFIEALASIDEGDNENHHDEIDNEEGEE